MIKDQSKEKSISNYDSSNNNISNNFNDNIVTDINKIVSDVNDKRLEDKLSYEFSLPNNTSMNVLFPNIFNKETIKLLEKWGLIYIECIKLRFNIAFDLKDERIFLLNLLNSKEVRNSLPGLSNILCYLSYKISKDNNINNEDIVVVDSIKYNRLTTNAINLDILDVIYENKLVNKESGYIKKDFEEKYEDIQINDKLKSALINPESENYCVFSDSLRNEFLFRIFMHVTVGGGINQYEDYVGEYMNVTKRFYKDFVSVSKIEESNNNNNSNIYKIRNYVYEIIQINNNNIFNNNLNPQNFLYVSVDPYQKSVSLWYNKWTSFFDYNRYNIKQYYN